MAARTDSQPKPDVGDILLVIHDFIARSSDELSLAKGDRVELIERDDEFGDGWFLGRHMANGNSGLFPEVYTRSSPKGVTPTTAAPKPAPVPQPPNTNGTSTQSSTSASTTEPTVTALGTSPINMLKPDPTPVTLPLNATKSEHSALKASPIGTAPLVSKSFSSPAGYSSLGRLNTQTQDSPVLHETLTVIDEHMNDLHSIPSNGGASHHATDSSSEYSAHMQDRLSYIQGEETDEEEEDQHTRTQVEAWNVEDVAEYLFTAGVEKKHCEVFRDQEISGEVLLGMDQSSLFLKAFDLGSVGRRLKTWQKIKSLQDEVNGVGQLTRRTTQTYGSDAGSEGSKKMRSRTNTLTSSQRLPPVLDRPGSAQQARRMSQTPKLDPVSPMTPVSPKPLHDSPTRPSHQKRPSAASVRDLHHSRRHSSTDYRAPGTALTPKIAPSSTFSQAEPGVHKKQPSFDRNWTMGNASTGSFPQRPSSSGGFNIISKSEENGLSESPVDLDRGYFSGTEVDGRKRNVLKKRDTISGHSQKSSYADEQRVRSATALSRHSRFGSVDSVGLDGMSAAQKYYGISSAHRRTASTKTTESLRPVPPSKDYPSPTVTKLENGVVEGTPVSPISPKTRLGAQSDWFAKPAKMAGFAGLRAISDAVTGSERGKIASPGADTYLKESPMQSPSTRTGSTTPSGGPSFELDSPDAAAKSPLSATTAGSQGRKPPPKKNKKETSAYLRGLTKMGPREAIKDADYSGWMKKKSSHLMTTWKPRLFVLKGRRLSYFYSEDDTEEKGLIDISFHRVLPADNERLTGLHATLTGASNTPMVPPDSSLQTDADASAGTDSLLKGDDSMFIFKLVPPRAGLSRAVNFTKPTVHYFAVPNLQQGRAWMAALMKATIDRDDTKPMTSTYQQKTISLAKARQMRHRPPALMNLDEKIEDVNVKNDEDDEKKNMLGISFGEVDSAISGLDKLGLQRVESANVRKTTFDTEKTGGLPFLSSPQSA